MNSPIDLDSLNADQLRALAAQLMTQVDEKTNEIRFKDARIAQLTHEMAVLKRWKFAARSEKLDSEQQSLLDEAIDADLVAIEHELEALSSQPKAEPVTNKPRRMPPPSNLPRVEITHEPDRRRVHAVANSSASVKTSARSSTTRPACSPSSAMCAANGCARSARR
jgi:hypothetical protein